MIDKNIAQQHIYDKPISTVGWVKIKQLCDACWIMYTDIWQTNCKIWFTLKYTVCNSTVWSRWCNIILKLKSWNKLPLMLVFKYLRCENYQRIYLHFALRESHSVCSELNGPKSIRPCRLPTNHPRFGTRSCRRRKWNHPEMSEANLPICDGITHIINIVLYIYL